MLVSSDKYITVKLHSTEAERVCTVLEFLVMDYSGSSESITREADQLRDLIEKAIKE